MVLSYLLKTVYRLYTLITKPVLKSCNISPKHLLIHTWTCFTKKLNLKGFTAFSGRVFLHGFNFYQPETMFAHLLECCWFKNIRFCKLSTFHSGLILFHLFILFRCTKIWVASASVTCTHRGAGACETHLWGTGASQSSLEACAATLSDVLIMERTIVECVVVRSWCCRTQNAGDLAWWQKLNI